MRELFHRPLLSTQNGNIYDFFDLLLNSGKKKSIIPPLNFYGLEGLL